MRNICGRRRLGWRGPSDENSTRRTAGRRKRRTGRSHWKSWSGIKVKKGPPPSGCLVSNEAGSNEQLVDPCLATTRLYLTESKRPF